MNKFFKNKKVVVMGLGLHGGGVGAVKFFHQQGAKILVTDLKKEKDLKKSLQKLKNIPAEFILGRHRKKDFISADLIVKNPAVSRDSFYLKLARDYNIPVKTDVEIFFDLVDPKQIIGITGTKGKSTTATLCYLFLKSKYPDTILAGNIGVSPLEIIPKIKRGAKIVLELSSFGLEGLKKSPHIAVVTSLFPDHLDRYKSFKDYLEAKQAIFKYQKKNDILILNRRNKLVKSLARKAVSKVVFFDGSNVSAAIAVAEIFRVSKKNIKKILAEFKGVPHRQELVAVKNGVRYINDTTATTPQSAILAIKTFKKRFPEARIILIAGGVDKNLDYKDLAKEIKKDVYFLVLLPGTASDKIKKRIGGFNNVYLAESMKKAVREAVKRAQKNDIVLLSPGAASFNLFKNEFDRGEQFIEFVSKN